MENRAASARSWTAIMMSATMRSSCHGLAPTVAIKRLDCLGANICGAQQRQRLGTPRPGAPEALGAQLIRKVYEADPLEGPAMAGIQPFRNQKPTVQVVVIV